MNDLTFDAELKDKNCCPIAALRAPLLTSLRTAAMLVQRPTWRHVPLIWRDGTRAPSSGQMLEDKRQREPVGIEPHLLYCLICKVCRNWYLQLIQINTWINNRTYTRFAIMWHVWHFYDCFLHFKMFSKKLKWVNKHSGQKAQPCKSEKISLMCPKV